MPPLSFLYYQIKFLTQCDLYITKDQESGNVFTIMRFHYILRFFFIAFAFTEAKNVVSYTKDFVHRGLLYWDPL